MFDGMRIFPHEAVPKCGSYELRFPDSRPSRYFDWDDIPGRRLITGSGYRRKAERTCSVEGRPEGFRLWPLSERCMSLSTHTAPIRVTAIVRLKSSRPEIVMPH